MRLEKYPRPRRDNGWGIHTGANAWHPLGEHEDKFGWWLDEFEAMGFSWVKLLVKDFTGIKPCREILRRGLMPILRMYRQQPKPGSIMDDDPERWKDREAIQAYVAEGVHYFELTNEDNYAPEWKDGTFPTDIEEAVRISVEDFTLDANFVLSVGGLPGFPSMAPTDGYPGLAHNDIRFYNLAFQYAKDRRAEELFRRGAWLSVHNAGLNHPVDYPDDPINQAEHPGQTIHDHFYADGSPTGASNCWRKYEAVSKLFHDAFGFHVPVLSTEGGFWVEDHSDPRYPRLDGLLQAERTLEACQRMKEAPPWYLCTGFWLAANRYMGNRDERWERQAWYSKYGVLPVVKRLKGEPKWVRDIPLPPPTLPVPEEAHVVPACQVEKVIDLLPKGPGSYKNRDPGLIDLLVIHHSAAPGDLPVERVAAYHLEKRVWPGIGYHYYVTADGLIHWCNWLETVSWHCGSYNRQAVGICLAGDFSKVGSRPTDAQLSACKGLIEALKSALGRQLELYGHKELAATVCPGAGWPDVRRYAMRGWRRYLA